MRLSKRGTVLNSRPPMIRIRRAVAASPPSSSRHRTLRTSSTRRAWLRAARSLPTATRAALRRRLSAWRRYSTPPPPSTRTCPHSACAQSTPTARWSWTTFTETGRCSSEEIRAASRRACRTARSPQSSRACKASRYLTGPSTVRATQPLRLLPAHHSRRRHITASSTRSHTACSVKA